MTNTTLRERVEEVVIQRDGWLGGKAIEEIITIVTEATKAACLEALPKEKTGFSLDDDAVNYKWIGRNEYRDEARAAIEKIQL